MLVSRRPIDTREREENVSSRKMYCVCFHLQAGILMKFILLSLGDIRLDEIRNDETPRMGADELVLGQKL